MRQTKNRNMNIEALRCVLMFLVVYQHCYLTGLWAKDGGYWGNGIIAFIHWHVIAFVAISGWFGAKFSFKKIVNLWGQVAYYSTLLFGISLVRGNSASNWREFLSTGGWFVSAYLMLLLCVPFLNAAIEKLIERGVVFAWKCWGLVMLGYILNWLPYHAFTHVSFATPSALSFLTVAFVYVTARLLAVTGIIGEKWKTALGYAFVGFVSYILLMCTMYKILNPNDTNVMCYYMSYENPFVWAMGLTVVCAVVHLRPLPIRIGRIVALISPSIFSVLLIHHGTPVGRDLYVSFQEWFCRFTNLHPFFIVLLSAIQVFVICIAVDAVRRGLFNLSHQMFLKLKGGQV